MNRLALAAAATLAAAALFSACRPGAAEARAKLATLEAILASHNDNDPRLDKDFLGLSVETKDALRAKYKAIAPERRNERGTIVYLLGKNLREPEDWEFLRAVAAEEPCLSLADCAKPGGDAGPGDAVTLAYPSLVAVRQAARAAAEGGSRQEARKVLDAALGSRVRAVTRLARSIDSGATAP